MIAGIQARTLFVGMSLVVAVLAAALGVQAFGQTFVVDPALVVLNAAVGGGVASTSFAVLPGEGEFPFPVGYTFYPLGGSPDSYCTSWNDNHIICEQYDIAGWADDGLLCMYLELGEPDDGTNSLTVPGDESDTITILLDVPCHSGECSAADPYGPPAFPEELLGQSLSCVIQVAGLPQVSLLTPAVAYAADGTDTLHVTAVVSEAAELSGPELTFLSEAGYGGVRGVRSSGPSPERGLAGRDIFTFKVVYTHAGNIGPENISVMLSTGLLEMVPDKSAADAALHDGDYTNGEQYAATSTFEQGMHMYSFRTIADGTETALEEGLASEPLSLVAGYPSVAFVPGFQASRLFADGIVSENKLWEPNREADASKLMMNEDGTSKNGDIYTKVGADGVVDEVFGFIDNVYKTFLSDLAAWTHDEHLIAGYAVVPYDWRYAYDVILGGGTTDGEKLYFDPPHGTDAYYIYRTLAELASSSDSGRVTVVGHSMGGLITKQLLADLEDDPDHPYRELLDRIDSVVLVASPQLGTPKAVTSLLHGMGQELDIPLVGWPNFATARTLRTLARNMPSAYTLLPSKMYFERVRDVGVGGEELDHTKVIDMFGDTDATSYETMYAYLVAERESDVENLIEPAQLRAELVDYGQDVHDRLDTWLPPDTDGDGAPDFRVVQIAGWGIAGTIRGVTYVPDERPVPCPPDLTGSCTETYLDPRPLLTYDGDSTVVLPSAVAMGMTTDEDAGVETWYVDMYQYNEDVVVARSHASILEINPVRLLIRSSIEHKKEDYQYVSTSADGFTAPEGYMRLALHSPVEASVTDAAGRRVGLNASSTNEAYYVNQNIPNSYYFTFGEGKYLGVPLEDKSYTLVLSGTATGTFTLELVEERGGVVHSTRTFNDVPVTEMLQGSVALTTLDDLQALELDADGDGKVDTVAYADELTPGELFDILKEEIRQLDSRARWAMLAAAGTAEHFHNKGRAWLAARSLRSVIRQAEFLSSDRVPVRVRISEVEANRVTCAAQALLERVST